MEVLYSGSQLQLFNIAEKGLHVFVWTRGTSISTRLNTLIFQDVSDLN